MFKMSNSLRDQCVLGWQGRELGVVAWRHEEVGEDRELVIREHLLVVLPVVVVRALELRQCLLDSYLRTTITFEIECNTDCDYDVTTHLYRLWVVDMRAEIHENSRNERWNVVGEGTHACAQAQDTGVTSTHLVGRGDLRRSSPDTLHFRASKVLKVFLKTKK